MSEFKFACPICGQHITADSKDTGSKISCPTCFRKIVVPQAPTSADTKFVLSASEADKPRPPQPSIPEPVVVEKSSQKTAVPVVLIAMFAVACAAGATLYAMRGKIFPPKPPQEGVAENPEGSSTGTQAQPQPLPQYEGTNLWTLNLSEVKFPEATLAGSLHHLAFTLERATLTGSNLTFRVGRSGTVELGLSVYFFNRQAEELSGKTAEVKPSDPTAPRVTMHWKDTDRHSETFHNGYAMKVVFGQAANNAIPGKIFLCLPDDAQSWIAGSFRAEIHKPKAPKTVSQPQTQ